VQILLAGTGDFPVITTTNVPDAMGGVPYSSALMATGGTTPYMWSLSAGTLPFPLAVTSDGAIAGTLASNISPGMDSFTVMVGSPNGPGFFSSQNLSLEVAAPFQISPYGIFSGKVGSPYSAALQASGGTPPYQNWMIIAGSLPPGLTLDPASGSVNGTPTASGNFSFTVTVNDSSGQTSVAAKLAILVVPALAILTQSLSNGFTGVAYYAVLSATGGFPPYKNWIISSGALPPGLALDPAAGVISGTPTTAAGSPFNFTITFSDSNSGSTPKAFTIAVSTPVPITMTLTTSANPSLFGKPLTLTANLSLPTPSGKVTFYDGTTVLGSATVSSGQAVLTTGLLPPGTHALRARFFAPPASATLSQQVNSIAVASFTTPVSYVSGNVNYGEPIPIVVADFNGDGKADLATFASVMLGNGDGTFQAPIVHPVGINPLSLVVADFDENGTPDVAIASQVALQVFLGKGDGTFSTPAIYTGGPGFDGVLAAADFNGDGHADLIVTTSSTPAQPAQLYLGIGDGTFRPALTVAIGLSFAGAITTGDFNGDGVPDFAVVDGSSGRVNVLLGNGDGKFLPPATYLVTRNDPVQGFAPSSMIACDLNADGNVDLIVYGPATDRLSVLLGRGDGTFRGSVDYLLGGSSSGSAIAVSDLNSDRIPDLAVSTGSTITLLLGNGDGSFRTGVSYPSGNSDNFLRLAAGEFNGDGRVDLLTATATGGVDVLLGSPVAGANQLSLSPEAIAVPVTSGGAPVTKTVTLSYQTTVQGSPTFTSAVVSSNGVFPWIAVSPASGTMTQASYSDSLYTYTSPVSITLDPMFAGNGFVYLGSVIFDVNGALASLPITMSIGAVPQATGIANAASSGQATPSVVAAGSYMAIYGTGLSGAGNASASSLPLPTMLNGTQATMGGIPVPLLYASSGQVNGVVPQELGPNNSYPLVISNGTASTAPVMVLVKELQPGIYTVDDSGSGPGIATDALTGQLIGAANPGHVSEYLTIYCTGLGPLQGPNGEVEPINGAAAPANLIFQTTAKVTASLGGVSAPVLFSGLAPGFAGLYQVNVQVPAGITPGSAVPLVITATDLQTGATARSNEVTIAVQ
jgi:uncharacterized protein (TIGR03437 family)